jgi:hypothetical protein
MARRTIVVASIVATVIVICIVYVLVYPIILRHSLIEEAGALEGFGFQTRFYEGPETSRPGLVVRIPYDWPADTPAFTNIGIYQNVIAMVAKGRWLSPVIFEAISRMRRLQEIWLDGQPLTDSIIEALKDHRGIKVLGLYGTDITSLDIISTLTDLEELDLRDVRINSTQVGALCNNKRLVYLRLWGIDVTDSDVAPLACLKNLKVLEIGLTKVTSNLASKIGNFANLEKIGMNNGIMSDRFLRQLLLLNNMKEIDVDYCPQDENLTRQVKARQIKFRSLCPNN